MRVLKIDKGMQEWLLYIGGSEQDGGVETFDEHFDRGVIVLMLGNIQYLCWWMVCEAEGTWACVVWGGTVFPK